MASKRRKRRRGIISASPVGHAPRRPTSNGEDKISFSFAGLDLENSKFAIPHEAAPSFLHALVTDALTKYSGFTEKEFRRESHRDHRHRIEFTTSSCPDGFGFLAEDLNQDAWQIAVCSGRPKHPQNKWRIYGYLVGAVFYIVWLDNEHDMFP